MRRPRISAARHGFHRLAVGVSSLRFAILSNVLAGVGMSRPKSSAATRCCSGGRVAVGVLVSVFGPERAGPAGRCRRGRRRRSVSRHCIRCGLCRRLGAVAVGSCGCGDGCSTRSGILRWASCSCLPVRVGAGLNGVGRSLDAVCRHVVGRGAPERVGGTCCRTPAESVRIGVARRRVRSCCSTWSSRVRVAETVALRGPGPGMGELSCGCGWGLRRVVEGERTGRVVRCRGLQAAVVSSSRPLCGGGATIVSPMTMVAFHAPGSGCAGHSARLR